MDNCRLCGSYVVRCSKYKYVRLYQVSLPTPTVLIFLYQTHHLHSPAMSYLSQCHIGVKFVDNIYSVLHCDISYRYDDLEKIQETLKNPCQSISLFVSLQTEMDCQHLKMLLWRPSYWKIIFSWMLDSVHMRSELGAKWLPEHSLSIWRTAGAMLPYSTSGYCLFLSNLLCPHHMTFEHRVHNNNRLICTIQFRPGSQRLLLLAFGGWLNVITWPDLTWWVL